MGTTERISVLETVARELFKATADKPIGMSYNWSHLTEEQRQKFRHAAQAALFRLRLDGVKA